ncbi:MAG: glycogen synthase GlgA [Pseudomonadota bacterium]
MKVLSVASEIYPQIKTGGLADVVGALPAALAAHGVETLSLVPGYPAIKRAVEGRTSASLELLGQPVGLVRGRAAGLDILMLDCPALFDREGGPYTDAEGLDWPDNWLRFAVLGRAALAVAEGAVEGFEPDLVHAHDWQAALAPVYLAYAGRPCPSVMTVHNIAFQGQFAQTIFSRLGLPGAAMNIDGVEYYGDVGYLKGGMQLADAVTTVSPTYAEEIRQPRFGMGLEGVVAARGDAVHGIVNGIDVEAWNPAEDAALPSRYDAKHLARRKANRAALAEEFGLTDDGPLFCVITRLTWQKGMDVLVQAIDGLVGRGGRLAVLGSGDAELEAAFQAAAERHQGRVGLFLGYSEPLAHRLQGGADAILIPSRFEPCGLTQLYGLRYGCVPVVARTGGLADTVIDANAAALNAGVATGIVFDEVEDASLLRAIDRSVALFAQPKTWQRMMRNGMSSDVSWERSAAAYAALYKSLV